MREKKPTVFESVDFWFTMIALVVLVVLLMHFLTKDTLPIVPHRPY